MQPPPESAEATDDDENKKFKKKLNEISRIASSYDLISKQVEESRTHDEQLHADDMNNTLMKNLVKVERLLEDKTEERWIQKATNPNAVYNIGQQETDEEEYKRFGPNPKFPMVDPEEQERLMMLEEPLKRIPMQSHKPIVMQSQQLMLDMRTSLDGLKYPTESQPQ